jgi:protein gp37
MLPEDWDSGYRNAWLGISVVNQEEAARDIPKLLETPAHLRFLSMEPLLEQVDIAPWLRQRPASHGNAIDWIIVGGESGPKARPLNPGWVRSLRAQCAIAGTAFFFKQWGEFMPTESTIAPPAMRRTGKKAAGRLLDGQIYDNIPEGQS